MGNREHDYLGEMAGEQEPMEPFEILVQVQGGQHVNLSLANNGLVQVGIKNRQSDFLPYSSLTLPPLPIFVSLASLCCLFSFFLGDPAEGLSND